MDVVKLSFFNINVRSKELLHEYTIINSINKSKKMSRLSNGKRDFILLS